MTISYVHFLNEHPLTICAHLLFWLLFISYPLAGLPPPLREKHKPLSIQDCNTYTSTSDKLIFSAWIFEMYYRFSVGHSNKSKQALLFRYCSLFGFRHESQLLCGWNQSFLSMNQLFNWLPKFNQGNIKVNKSALLMQIVLQLNNWTTAEIASEFTVVPVFM